MAAGTPAQQAYLWRRAKAMGLDVSVLRANAAFEGLSGGIGDGGHAFGPFQMNDAGGVLTGKLPGHWTPQQKNQWAWSKAGIDMALRGIKSVMGNKRGAAAMKALVLEYERPANKHQKLQERLAAWKSGKYGTTAAGPAGGLTGPGTTRQVSRLNQAEFKDKASQAFFMASQAAAAGDLRPMGQLATAIQQARMSSMTQVSLGGGKSRGGATLTIGGGGAQGGGGINELIHDPMRMSIFDGQRKAGAYGGHGKHVHVSMNTPRAMLSVIRKAQQLGLNVGENPYTTGQRETSGHTSGSRHYQLFKGKYNGRELGKGADVSGDPRKMKAFYTWVARNYG